ncbi:unnamed protein product [Phaeothamnion confervicola]
MRAGAKAAEAIPAADASGTTAAEVVTATATADATIAPGADAIAGTAGAVPAAGAAVGRPGFAFLVSGDVYRRDEIDSSHYPVFHQMEGVRVFSDSEVPPGLSPRARAAVAEADLKGGLEAMARALFGEVEMRWVDAYFPFTHPSAELEIRFRGEWLEVLGCGVVHEGVFAQAGLRGRTGWAFGLGLERLAMVLFSVPDIRLFWSEDRRFLDQFQAGEFVAFQPYSKHPPCHKDISFWVDGGRGGGGGKGSASSNGSGSAIGGNDAVKQGSEMAAAVQAFHDNDLFELVRDVAGDLVERIELIDKFKHPKTKRVSKCFRITYRSMDRSLTNEEIDHLQAVVRARAPRELNIELR